MSGEARPPEAAESPFQRILRNFALLLRGRWIAGVMTFAATTLMARALGPHGFGLVALMHAYVLLVRGLLNFQPFEAVVRFGVPLLEGGDSEGLARLAAVCRRVDRRASRIATVLGVAAAPLAAWVLDLDRGQLLMLMLYSLSLLATGNGTATGVLRLYDRFDVIGKQMSVGPMIRIVGVTLAWYSHADLSAFVATWALAYLGENAYINWRGWREYRQRLGDPLALDSKPRARLSEFAGLRGFLWVTYWQSSLDLIPKHLAMVMAGSLLGPAAAGLLRLAREYASLLIQPTVLVRQVVFVDLTRSWHQRSPDFARVTWRAALVAGGVGLGLSLLGWLIGPPLLSALAGKQFVAAGPVLTLLLFAASLNLAESPLRAAAYAIGKASVTLRLHGVATVVYVGLFISLCLWIGLIGAGFATVAAAIIPLSGLIVVIRRRLRETEPSG